MTDPTRAAIIGTGAIAHAHAQAIASLQPRIALVAVVDVDEQRARAFADEFAPGAVVYTDAAQLLAHEELDLVHICTPPQTHVLLAVAALRAGIPALIEKPTALSLAAMDELIAVSRETRADVLRLFNVAPERVHVIHNGIDPAEYRVTPGTDVLTKYGIDPARPFLLFVGRITRQKGIIHLVNAIPHIDPALQIVLCAGAPDTPEIGREMEEGVAQIAARRPGVIWIRDMISRPEVIQLYTNAAVFCCPSVYEPFGIINLEAMACETAVVATATGGIPEVVVPGETGLLVPIEQADDGTGTPLDPDGYVAAFAEALTAVVTDPDRAAAMGRAGRQRAIDSFSWDAIAGRTCEIYADVLA